MRGGLVLVLLLVACGGGDQSSDFERCGASGTELLNLTPSAFTRGANVTLVVDWWTREPLLEGEARLFAGPEQEVEVFVPLWPDFESELRAFGELVNPFGFGAPAGAGALVVSGASASCPRIEAATSFELE